MAWLLVEPGHQQLWYWLCKPYWLFSSTGKDFKYHRAISSWRNSIKWKYKSIILFDNSACKRLMIDLPLCIANPFVSYVVYRFCLFSWSSIIDFWCVTVEYKTTLTQCNSDTARILFRFWTNKRHLYLSLTGKLWASSLNHLLNNGHMISRMHSIMLQRVNAEYQWNHLSPID